jgi:hypothetical protein
MLSTFLRAEWQFVELVLCCGVMEECLLAPLEAVKGNNQDNFYEFLYLL